MPPNLHLSFSLFLALVLGGSAGFTVLAQNTPSEAVALEEINKIARAKPDSAITLLLPYLSSPADSIRGKALNYLGNAFYFKSQYDSAIRYFGLSADIFKALGDEENLAKNYNNMGVAHYFLSQYQKAFEYHKTAMEIRERTNDPQVTSSYNNLGLVLTELGSAPEALTYYKKSLDAKIRYRQFAGLSTTLTNISNIFRSQKQLDSALRYDQQNLHHLDSLPDQRNQATCYNNLSITYIDLRDYPHAEAYALKALTLEKSLERGFEIVNVCKNLAIIYLAKNQPALANTYLDSALVLVKNAGDYRSVLGVYTLQAKLDSLRGNPGAAYFHLLNYVQAKARFDETEQKDLVLELEKKYEGELKEQKILELEQVNTIKDLEAEQSKQFRLYLLVVVLLLLVAAGVLYSRFRLKQRTAQLLDAKNKELQDLNQVKDRLFAIISHDLKSPLSSFHTVTSTLNQYYTQISPDDIRKYLEKLENAAKSLEEQMKNLLEWSVNQIAERKLKTEQVDLADMASNLKAFFQLNLDVKRQNMYVQMDAPLLVETDREYIQTVLRNLISNAIKFTPPEGSVWVKGRVTGDTVVVQVEDSGIGIAREDFAKLFTLTADKKSIGSSPEKGTGLGLVLVKEMMDRLGGTIDLTSEPGKGTNFTLTLSRRAAEKAA